MARLAALVVVICVAFPSLARAAPLHVHWIRGVAAPGTPARYDKVGVIEVGPRSARNVLVLEPGTSAGAAYFVPLARWIAARARGWQVWSVERRENLLEDQSVLERAKRGQASSTELFDYYLGWLVPGASSGRHIRVIPDTRVKFAKRWGMQVAVEDLHRVVGAARRRGGRVVLGGHSLGGAIVTAYATWSFGGRPGADGSEWYFPRRLTIDAGAVGNGDPQPGPGGPRRRCRARPEAPAPAPDLRLRRPARWWWRAAGRPRPGCAVGHPGPEPRVDQPSGVIRPQRPGRRLPPQPFRGWAGAVPPGCAEFW